MTATRERTHRGGTKAAISRTTIFAPLVALCSWAGSLNAADGGVSSPGALFLPARSTPLVALRFVLRVGSQDDPKGKEGLASLTAAMVAEGGTKDLTYDQ